MAGARLSFEERKAVCIHLCIQSVYKVCIHFFGPLCIQTEMEAMCQLTSEGPVVTVCGLLLL